MCSVPSCCSIRMRASALVRCQRVGSKRPSKRGSLNRSKRDAVAGGALFVDGGAVGAMDAIGALAAGAALAAGIAAAGGDAALRHGCASINAVTTSVPWISTVVSLLKVRYVVDVDVHNCDVPSDARNH